MFVSLQSRFYLCNDGFSKFPRRKVTTFLSLFVYDGLLIKYLYINDLKYFYIYSDCQNRLDGRHV